ncbi:hypothetical protein CRG98_011081 [Punica granatum]|uniref:Uncharacterized protein n=1 Tax=Punica granatum TaxID=22663 RepID=A0A2I0KJ36_PUNGR|nr:hypothetical protein CRG98_011081 [Punica granatum]
MKKKREGGTPDSDLRARAERALKKKVKNHIPRPGSRLHRIAWTLRGFSRYEDFEFLEDDGLAVIEGFDFMASRIDNVKAKIQAKLLPENPNIYHFSEIRATTDGLSARRFSSVRIRSLIEALVLLYADSNRADLVPEEEDEQCQPGAFFENEKK